MSLSNHGDVHVLWNNHNPLQILINGAAVLTGFIEPFVVNILVEGRGKRGNPLPGENAGSRSPGNLCRS